MRWMEPKEAAGSFFRLGEVAVVKDKFTVVYENIIDYEVDRTFI